MCLLDREIQDVTKTWALRFAEDGIFRKANDPTVFVLSDGIFIIFFQVGAGHF